MTATFKASKLQGSIDAPPSKSMAHRYLIGAAISGQKCILSGVDYSEDILASIDCLRALGADITTDKDTVTVDPKGFMQAEDPVLDCRESGSTLRFFIPLALLTGKKSIFYGTQNLLSRPLSVYQGICKEQDLMFVKEKERIEFYEDLGYQRRKLLLEVSAL